MWGSLGLQVARVGDSAEGWVVGNKQSSWNSSWDLWGLWIAPPHGMEKQKSLSLNYNYAESWCQESCYPLSPDNGCFPEEGQQLSPMDIKGPSVEVSVGFPHLRDTDLEATKGESGRNSFFQGRAQ